MKEIRCFASEVEVRNGDSAAGEGKRLSGYAIRFNDVTTIGGQFDERVANTALDGVDMKGVHALYNHNWDMPLGKEGLNMRLAQDEKGLRVDIDLNNTSYANDLYENVRTGVVGGMSFGFTIADDEWEKRDGLPLRTINQIDKLFEVTFTSAPAYPTTEVGLRSLEAATAETVEVPTEEVVEETPVAEAAPEVEEVTVEAATEEAPVAEVTEEVVAEASNEEVEAPSAEDTTVESPTLAITKEEALQYLVSLN